MKTSLTKTNCCVFLIITLLYLNSLSAQNQVRNYELDDLINVVRLSDKTIVIRAGVNYYEAVSAISTEKGIVVIDAGNTLQLTEKYREIIKKEFNRDDFIYLINTHSHRDHTWGNGAIPVSDIIAHSKSKTEMEKDWKEREAYFSNIQKRLKESEEKLKSTDINSDEGKQLFFDITKFRMILSDFDKTDNFPLVMPTVTFDDRLQLNLGNITIELIYFGNAHCESDTWVYVREEKLLFNGDVFFKNGLANLTYFATEETGGKKEIKRWIEILTYLYDTNNPVEKIVRGHGDIMNNTDLKTFSNSIHQLWKESEEGKEIYPLNRIKNIIENEGTEKTQVEIKKLMTTHKNKFFFIERGFNVVVNDLINRDKLQEAVEISKMNVGIFPNSINAYLRLADLYLTTGNRDLAIKNFEKVLELNPQNPAALEQLKKLTTNK